jgi:hypothetical protein
MKDGDTVTLVLRPGWEPNPDNPSEPRSVDRAVTGTVRRFEQLEGQVEGEPARKDNGDTVTETVKVTRTYSVRWEILTDDPAYPAIGFDPKTAQLK